ncbi:two-component system response regulator [Aliarcobacter faecis]|uniref:response regulator transcription factor n=1 Tax=Aliarcobacter faecis TaxID=1564138 RepID=UPI00047E13EC|nr:response regulator transcription factor [Aliarcobacter faecis]QKF73159.1 two-component system response regulator [Aliarcobacter faecis]
MKLLLLEDDIALSDILNDFLSDNGFNVTLCENGQDALENLIENRFDLAILDINTPSLSGLEVLIELRNRYKNNIPIIIITAYQDINNLKKAFENRADDYIRKPFDLEELNIRISKLKREFLLQEDSVILDNTLIFKPELSQIIKDGKIIHIAQKERDILRYFINHKGRVISNEELFSNIWTYDEVPSDATIRVYIKSLREIIGKNRIVTIRGVGYKFE